MNILFCTQSESLHLFYALQGELKATLDIDKTGFIVADSMAYGRFVATKSAFEQDGYYLLKEWEVTAPPFVKPDYAKLARYEKELGGEPGLFGAIVADRRLFMGPDCTYSQDYRRRFTDDELLCILQRGLEKLEYLFDTLQPDLLVGFICVTMLDYLAYLFARARGVRVMNLRPTRIGDRVSFSNYLNDPSPELAASFKRITNGGQTKYLDASRAYIKRVRERHGRYEGVVRPSDRPILKANTTRFTRLSGMISAVRNYLSYRSSIAAKDNHVPNPLRTLWFTAVRNPYRARSARHMLGSIYVMPDQLEGLRYAFFPLHTEPEVSLLVYGRPYVNQIEIIRTLAMSLPVDMVLVVKEHPWMVGKRSLSAYKKILNIPRLKLADPSTEARTLISGAALVVVVTGSVALEAAMLGKPVITFGDCPYNLLPKSMVRRCNDPRKTQMILQEAISEYTNDEKALESYVSAVYETSASVNLYSVLLGKKNVHSERSSAYSEEIQKLANHLIEELNTTKPVNELGAATW